MVVREPAIASGEKSGLKELTNCYSIRQIQKVGLNHPFRADSRQLVRVEN